VVFTFVSFLIAAQMLVTLQNKEESMAPTASTDVTAAGAALITCRSNEQELVLTFATASHAQFSLLYRFGT